MTDTPLDPFGPQRAPRPDPQYLPQLDYTSLSLHKIALIAGLAIATILPNLFISNLIEERETRQAGVREEFKRNWGPEQSLYTPMLVIPYQAGERPRQYVKITPARLDLRLRRSVRRSAARPVPGDRSMTRASTCRARSWCRPRRALRDVVTDKDGRFLWSEAAVVFGAASSLTGLRATDSITVAGTERQLMPCLEALRAEQVCRGAALVIASAPLAAAARRRRARAVQIDRELARHRLVRGAVRRQGTGRDGPLAVAEPSFNGNTLPTDSAISADGFQANWQAVELGSPRISASSTLVDTAKWSGATIGVELIEGTPIYRMINRVAKYGLLFVVLAFATYFFFEVLSRLRIHIVQYGLLGLSLSLFSLLLLSLAEPIGYTTGYLVAAGLVLTQSTLYTAAVARRIKPAFVFAVMLTSLFGFIYVLLGLETYSLLIGALALFVVVSALMVLTQMVKWPGRAEVAAAV
jgi:inner membrane protein